MDTLTVFTLELARAFGVYIIATGLAGLAAPDRWRLMLEEFQRSPALTYITGVIVLGLGLALVMAHNHWTDPLAIIVSLTGWIALAEGLVLMIAPEPFVKLGAAIIGSPNTTRLWSLAALIIGAALLIAGLTGHATISS